MTKAPVEMKVRAATSATFLVSLVLVVLNAVAADNALLGPPTSWLQAIVIALLPAGLTFLSGWQAKHAPRVR
ncbi:holin [Streptomyces acidicola]|uniref:holin n=1 Tax=Streptomyces acidicola TaxID=2596892 RepID=UPI00343615CF